MKPSLIALAAACGFAVSTSLQHRAASGVPGPAGAVRLVLRLLATPLWLLGSALGLVAFALHALALHLGALALVQPLMLCGVVLAVPVRAALGRRLPHRSELTAVSLTVLGLALFLSATRLTKGYADPSADRAAAACAGVLAAFLLLIWLAARQRVATRRAALLGAASGVVFGAMAGLIKFVAHDVQVAGAWPALATWRPWVLLLAGLGAVTTNQRAFHAARLAASMPILNVVNVLVAMAFGWIVFDEAPVRGPLSLAAQLGSAALVVAGLTWIARLEPAAPAQAPAPSRPAG
ncbi:DMT family transporter [Nocardioides sp. MAHUQ-72]|uniref:DMT family transporter n=1 Tax=unclassified Nocardioides TaxID=2615069 RepID=UPI003623F3A4